MLYEEMDTQDNITIEVFSSFHCYHLRAIALKFRTQQNLVHFELTMIYMIEFYRKLHASLTMITFTPCQNQSQIRDA